MNLLQLESEERVAALLAVRDFAEHENALLLFATRLGKVKRTALAEYANIRSSGLRAVAINPGDDLLSVHLTDGTLHVFMGTHHGMGIRFEEAEARPMGRVSAGVRGINLREGDGVEEVATFVPAAENDILVVTDLGFGKRTPVADFRLQQRGGYGLKAIQLTEKNGKVAAIRHVHESDQILVLTEKGILIRVNVDEIRNETIVRDTSHMLLFFCQKERQDCEECCNRVHDQVGDERSEFHLGENKNTHVTHKDQKSPPVPEIIIPQTEEQEI